MSYAFSRRAGSDYENTAPASRRDFPNLLSRTAMALAVAVGLVAAASPASAATVTIDLDTVFSGGQPAGATTPWVSVTFDDAAVAGGLQMTISTPGLTGTEYLRMFFFNIEEFLRPTVEWVSGVEALGAGFRQDWFAADAADNTFDARFRYQPSREDGVDPPLFTGGLTSVYNLLQEDLTLAHIMALSSQGHLVAARVQGFNGGDSSWITGAPAVVPLPPAALLFLTGLLGMGLMKRCRKAA